MTWFHADLFPLYRFKISFLLNRIILGLGSHPGKFVGDTVWLGEGIEYGSEAGDVDGCRVERTGKNCVADFAHSEGSVE